MYSCSRVVHDLDHRPGLDDAAGLEDLDARGDRAHQGEVVGHEHHADAPRLPQALEQLDDRALHGHVEGRGDLVADHHVGLGGERPCDGDALALTTREPAGLVAQHPGSEGDLVEQVDRTVGGVLARGDAEELHRPLDDLLDGQPRVQRQVGVLEDVLQPLAVQRTALAGALREGVALEADRARPVLVQAADRSRDRGLAAAGLAHQGDHLGLGEVEADVVDDVLLAVEHVEALDGQDDLARLVGVGVGHGAAGDVPAADLLGPDAPHAVLRRDRRAAPAPRCGTRRSRRSTGR